MPSGLAGIKLYANISLSYRRVADLTGRYIMRLLLKVIALTMITSFPFSTNAGTYLDLHEALTFKQHGQYGKAFPILLQLSENGLVRAQMELADMYVNGHGIRKNNDEAIYWACRAAQSGEFRALKFRIKLALRTTSDNYQPQQCSQIMKSRFRLRDSIVRQNLSSNLH